MQLLAGLATITLLVGCSAPSGPGGPCEATSCAALGATCGVVADGCGGVASCGGCAGGLSCGGGGVANVCGDGACVPVTCLDQGATCGTVSDGCAGLLECGGCLLPLVCGGDGVANVCGGGDPGDPGAPRILSLTSNTALVRSDQFLVVTAVVTDPDGVDDVIGGTLVNPASGAAYGAFATSAAEGSYEIDLSWADLDTVRAIDAPTSGVERRLLARFFDVAGGRAEAELVVRLRCADDDESACAGECFDLRTDRNHCGACDRVVTGAVDCRDGVPSCPNEGETPCGDRCVSLEWSATDCGACGASCAAYEAAHELAPGSASCLAGSCGFYAQTYGDEPSCAALCGAEGLGCAPASSDFSCDEAGGSAVGCATYENEDFFCNIGRPITSCAEVMPATMDTGDGCGNRWRWSLVCYCR